MTLEPADGDHHHTFAKVASFMDGSKYLQIATHLRGGQFTLSRLARAMAATEGSIHRQLHQMLEDGLVASDREEGGRGAEFWVPEDKLESLEQALAEAQPLGQVVEGQVALRVDEITSLRDVAEVIADANRTATVVWAAEAGDGYLLILSRLAPLTVTGSLRTALETAGCRCRAFRLGAPMRPAALRALGVAWRDAGDAASSLGRNGQ